MAADHGCASTTTTRPTHLAVVAVAIALMIGAALPSGTYAEATATASKHCVSFVDGAPCLGPIEAYYSMSGGSGWGGGAVRSIPAKLGPEVEIGKEPNGEPIMRRSLSWRAVSGVTLAAAYVMAPIVKNGKAAFSFRRIPTGAHSGHVTLTAANNETVEDAPTSVSALFVLLEGSK